MERREEGKGVVKEGVRGKEAKVGPEEREKKGGGRGGMWMNK